MRFVDVYPSSMNIEMKTGAMKAHLAEALPRQRLT